MEARAERLGVRQEDCQAFCDELVQALPSLRGYALRLTREADAADDLAQETVLRALRFRHRYRLGTNCRAWLRTILRNLFLAGFWSGRAQWERTGIDGCKEFAATEPPGDQILRALLAEGVRAAVRAVPEPFRSAVVMVDLSDLSYEQVAALLDVPVGTVKSRVCRGRRFLRKRLAESRARPAATAVR